MTLFFLQRHDNCYFLRNCSFPTSESFSWNMQIDIWTKAQEEPYAYFWSSFSFQVFNSTKILPSLLNWKYDLCFLTSVRLLNSTQVNPPSASDMELPPGKQHRITWLHFSQKDRSYAAYFPRFKISHFLFSFRFSSSLWRGGGANSSLSYPLMAESWSLILFIFDIKLLLNYIILSLLWNLQWLHMTSGIKAKVFTMVSKDVRDLMPFFFWLHRLPIILCLLHFSHICLPFSLQFLIRAFTLLLTLTRVCLP